VVGVPWLCAPKAIGVGPKKLLKEITIGCQCRASQQKLSHRKLGGLTRATAMVVWSGNDEHGVKLRTVDYPVRPVDKFVELTADLPAGRTRQDLKFKVPWWVAKDGEPFRWPAPE
jgi:hypothetical protein